MQRRLWLHLVHDLGVIVEFSGDKGGLEGERSALALDAGSWGGAGEGLAPGPLCCPPSASNGPSHPVWGWALPHPGSRLGAALFSW